MSGVVNFVFCIDAEGPLYESTEACFQRLNSLFGLQLEVSEENLNLLQEGKIDLGGIEKDVAQVVSPAVRDWIDNWKDLLENVKKSNSGQFRKLVVDDMGTPLVFNWFVCDWIGFHHNPRRKPMGINLVFSHYWSLFAADPERNPLYFHHHSTPFSSCTHHPCKNWTNSQTHILKLSSNLLEYGHFPNCVRSPIMAPDINLFFEQYFPFDMSNTSVKADGQPDILRRRWTDWTQAPDDWTVYHPDFYNYQVPGSMRRAIGRCTQFGSRYGNLDERELRKAFEKAQKGEKVLVSCYVHDHSPMDKVKFLFEMINKTRSEYSDVAYYNKTAVEAFQDVLGLEITKPITFEVSLEGKDFYCRSDKDLFGPQPWFCFKTKENRYHWDNMDILSDREWRYIFDEYTFPLDLVDTIAIASNDLCGNTSAIVYSVRDGIVLDRGATDMQFRASIDS